MAQNMPMKTLLDRYFQTATQIWDEILAYQPDVIIALLHSGWMPLSAGMELWKRTQQSSFPPPARVNLG